MSRPLAALCGDALADGLDADAGGATDVVVVRDLCHRPSRLTGLDAAGRPLVLGLCSGAYELGAFQREVRRLGTDPLGAEIVHPEEAAGDRDRLGVLLRGAAARASAFRGSTSEQWKTVLPGAVSRRSVLTFSLPEYVATPSVDDRRCAALRGCRACVAACPRAALSIQRGRVVHDRAACEPCGRCVTACPTGAMENPAATPSAVEAQVRAVLDPRSGPPGPRGIVFRCRRATRLETSPGWYPVTVPCAGMVSEAWILAPLVLGASAVAVRSCADGGCSLGNDALVAARVAWCAGLLAAAGGAVDRVTSAPDAPPRHRPLAPAELDDPFGPTGAAGVLVAVTEHAGGSGGVAHAGGPIGLVDITAGPCTGCGTCATSCPTGALALEDRTAGTAISFDPGTCVACGTCVTRCPEATSGAIGMTPAVDTNRLRQGRSLLWEGAAARCERCGVTIASAALLAHFADRLGDDRLMTTLSSRCPACRGR